MNMSMDYRRSRLYLDLCTDSCCSEGNRSVFISRSRRSSSFFMVSWNIKRDCNLETLIEKLILHYNGDVYAEI